MRHPRTVICLSPVKWDGLFQRHQHLMTLFSKSDRVIFVDPFTSIGDNPFGGLQKRPVTMVNRNLAVVSSLHPITVSRSEWVMKLAMAGLSKRLDAILERLDWRGPRLLWLARPEGFSLVGRMREELCVYDCVDEHWAFSPGNSDRARVIDFMEMNTLRRADLVIATSSSLRRKISVVNPRVREIGNGVDTEAFTPRTASERRSGKFRVAGFVGAMYEWVDLELVSSMARAFPRVSFMMVGPVRAGSGSRGRRHFGKTCNPAKDRGVPGNLCFTGPVPYHCVPGLMRGFDVGLVPFRVNDLTRAADPIKIYEYLACGLPVVSTPIAEAMKFNGLVRIGKTPEHFEEELSRALEDAGTVTDEEISGRRLAAVSWQDRFEAILDLIDGVFPE